MTTSTTTPVTTAPTIIVSSGMGTILSTGEAVSDQVSAARQRLHNMKKRREELELLAVLQKEEEQEAAETRRLQEQLRSQQSVRPKVADAASKLRVRNQPSETRQPENSSYRGLTMPEIRRVPGLGLMVEDQVDRVRTEVPSLARRPNAPLGGPRQQRSVSRRQPSARDVSFDPVRIQRSSVQQTYAQDLIAFDDIAPVRGLPHVQQAGHQQVDLLSADPETDPSDEEDPCQEMRLVYRRDKNGMKYRNWEPVQVEEPAVVYEWMTDKRTGRQYKQPVAQSRVRAHRSCSSSARTIPSKYHERGPTFLSLPNSEKEGKVEKKQSVVDWARKCPVLWAEKVAFDSTNAIVWLWGYLSELLDSRTNNPAALVHGVLEAKLQHALCVLEVCATHSEKTDFDSQGWKIARLYAHKVQAQLDRGLVTWESFAEFKANPHPSELIAAKQELDQRQRVAKKTKGEEVKANVGGPTCNTWNSSKVEGKCDWQVRNPDKGKCNRRHVCSYCSEKGHMNTHHQKSFCARRTAAGDS